MLRTKTEGITFLRGPAVSSLFAGGAASDAAVFGAFAGRAASASAVEGASGCLAHLHFLGATSSEASRQNFA